MRIALVHPFSWPEVWRGAERYLHDLAWYLAQGGHDVEVVTGTERDAGTTTADGIVFHRYHHKLHPALRRVRLEPVDSFGGSALRHLVGRRYEIVHALTPTAAIAGRLSGHRTVYTSIGASSRAGFRTMPWSWPFFRLAVRTATVCTALGSGAASLVARLTGRRPVVLPPGVRTDRFTVNQQPRTGPPRILFCSDAAEPRKGLGTLLAALDLLLDRHPEARLQLAGPGDQRPALAELGPGAERVLGTVDRFPPEDREGLLRLYREATVTALPSWEEAFGLVLIESLASGTPVVCTDVGGPGEIVEPGTGAVARPRDADSLAHAIHEAIALARDPATPGRCAARSRAWDWMGAVGPAHECLYRRVQELGREAEEAQVWQPGRPVS